MRQEITEVNEQLSEEKPKIPHEYLCSITREIMKDPVLIASGYTYERSAILEWFKEKNTDPITNSSLKNKEIIPNNSLRILIKEFLERYPELAPEKEPEERVTRPLNTAIQVEGNPAETAARIQIQQAQNREATIFWLLLDMGILSSITYFAAWLLTNSAGPLMVTVAHMDNCLSDGTEISDPNDSRYTVSCTQLQNMNSAQNWPTFGVYGCWDGRNYQTSVASLLVSQCTSNLIQKCASFLTSAFFSGSRAEPYSQKGEYVNAYGTFCDKDKSSWLSAAFIMAVLVAAGFGVHTIYLGARLWKQRREQSTTATVTDPLLQQSDRVVAAFPDAGRYT